MPQSAEVPVAAANPSGVAETLPRTAEGQSAKAQVAVVFTGGTIAMTSNKISGVIPALSGRDIMARIPEISQYLPDVAISVHDFATLPGPHISPQMMLTLSDFASALLEQSDGVVITHGTDTMEECAYFLDLVMDKNDQVVFTGSMHPATDNAWDGGKNLIDAIAVSRSTAFKGEGALVVMDGAVHAASEVTKTHTMRLDTFRSPDFGPLGVVNTLEMVEPQRARGASHRCSLPLGEDAELPYVELLKTYTGMDDQLFRATLKADVAGIVVEAMGQGNVPPGAINGIARACEMNVPVVITSRCGAGPVRPYYAYEGAGLELKRLGCIFAPYQNGQKARIKLMIALAAGLRDEKLHEVFAQQ